MWTSKNRARYDRSKLRYPSDLTAPLGPIWTPSSIGRAPYFLHYQSQNGDDMNDALKMPPEQLP
jgi:hypothetical protein